MRIPSPVGARRTELLHTLECVSFPTMATNLAIDDELLERALRVGGLSSKKATVNEALREFIARRKRLGALELIGTIEFADDFDPKRARAKR